MVRAGIIAAIFIAMSASSALADGGARVTPDRVWRAWSWDPLVIFNLAILALLYGRGTRLLRRKSNSRQALRPVHIAAFYVSLLVIALALLSPIDALGQELSSLHMVQHTLLMTVAAPLFILGAPMRVLARGIPPAWRQISGLHWLSHPLTWQPIAGWLLFAVALWGWHHPLLYQAALRDPLVHDAQHLTFFAAGLLFWRLALDPFSRRRLHPVPAIVYLFATSLHASVLGIFMALAPEPWYLDYTLRTPAFGLTPLPDQQLAGLVMWVPACLIYPILAVALVGRWLAAQEPALQTLRRPLHE